MPNEHVPAAAIGLPFQPPIDRAVIEAQLEQLLAAADGLIAMLDALDVPHEDLEDPQEDFDGHGFTSHSTDDEDSLGSLAAGANESQERWSTGCCGDLEDEHDGREHGSALEWATTIHITQRDPEGRALAYRVAEGDQSSWAFVAAEDLEDEGDSEPNLAGFHGSDDDREWDPAEMGIADQDGLMEQVSASVL